MAGELQLAGGPPGATVYSVVRSAVGQVWYTVTPAFENYNSAHWTSYAIAMVEQSPGYYVGNFPSAITVGVYEIETLLQAGDSPATSDVTIGSGELRWDGAAVAVLPTALAAADALLGRNVAGGSSSGRTVSTALYVLRNKVAIVTDVMTVYGIDDSTVAFQANVTESAGANPLSASTPTTVP